MAAAALLLAAIAISVAWLSSRHGPLPRRAAIKETRNASQKRPVYPYSVVPGGVYSADELKAAVAQDAVVAAHYAGFGASRVQRMSLESDRPAYVSFRIDKAVFWTKRPVSLRRGEEVLSDGESLVRARCGNRISNVPRNPVSSHEPLEGALDEAEPALVEPPGQLDAELLRLARNPTLLELQPSVISDQLALNLPSLSDGDIPGFEPMALPPGSPLLLLIAPGLPPYLPGYPILPPIVPDSPPDSPDEPILPPVTPDPPPAPVLVPEASSVVLLVSSVLIIGVVFRKRWKRSGSESARSRATSE
jgi:hypothetical protein